MSTENEQDIKINDLENQTKTMSEKIDDLKETFLTSFSELKKDLKDNYVSKDSFLPVRAISYGLVGALLLAILSSIVSSIIK